MIIDDLITDSMCALLDCVFLPFSMLIITVYCSEIIDFGIGLPTIFSGVVKKMSFLLN
jgi:hypothetical protein